MFFPPLPELVLLLQERQSQIGLQCAHLLINHEWIFLDGLKNYENNNNNKLKRVAKYQPKLATIWWS